MQRDISTKKRVFGSERKERKKNNNAARSERTEKSKCISEHKIWAKKKMMMRNSMRKHTQLIITYSMIALVQWVRNWKHCETERQWGKTRWTRQIWNSKDTCMNREIYANETIIPVNIIALQRPHIFLLLKRGYCCVYPISLLSIPVSFSLSFYLSAWTRTFSYLHLINIY